MKKFLLILICLPIIGFGQWQYVGNPNFIEGNNTFWSMDLHQGTPYIALNDLSVMKFDGMNWIYVGNPEFISEVADEDDGGVYIKIDPSGIPYIAFLNSNTGGGSPTVMYFNGTTWVNLNSNIIAESDWFSFDIDQEGNLFMAYGVDDLLEINISKYNGVYWESLESVINEGLLTEGPMGAGAFSLKISSENIPYVVQGVYPDGVASIIKTYKLVENNWEMFADFSCEECFVSEDLLNTFAAGDEPFLLMMTGDDYSLEVLKYSESLDAWEEVVDLPLMEESEWPFGISVNQDGIPYVLYTDEQQCFGDDYASVYKLNDGVWESVGNNCFQLANNLSSALVFDNNIPYALSDESEPSVMWLPSEGGLNIESEILGAHRNLNSITNLLGQEILIRKNTPMFYIYDDGSVEKKIIIE